MHGINDVTTAMLMHGINVVATARSARSSSTAFGVD